MFKLAEFLIILFVSFVSVDAAAEKYRCETVSKTYGIVSTFQQCADLVRADVPAHGSCFQEPIWAKETSSRGYTGWNYKYHSSTGGCSHHTRQNVTWFYMFLDACDCDQNFISNQCVNRAVNWGGGTSRDTKTGAIIQLSSSPNNQGLFCAREIIEDSCEYGASYDWIGNPINCVSGEKRQEISLLRSTDSTEGVELRYFSVSDSSEATPSRYTLPYPDNVELIDLVNPANTHGNWVLARPEIIDYGSGIKAMVFPKGSSYLFIDGEPNKDHYGTLLESGTGFNYERNGRSYYFNAAGELTRIEEANGRVVTYTNLSNNTLEISKVPSVATNITLEPVGKDGALVPREVVGPNGEVFKMIYQDGYLTKISYPDNTASDDQDNPVQLFEYFEFEDGEKLLSGIYDELGNLYAHWEYDDLKRAVLSEHGGGAEKITVEYLNDSHGLIKRTVKTYSESSSFSEVDYEFKALNGSYKPLSVTTHPCLGCTVGTTTFEYDSNGYLERKTAQDGTVTEYTYNSRGLLTSKTEAVGTPQERTVTKTWHSHYRLPLTVDEPDRLTTYGYDANGNRISKSVQDKQTQEVRTWIYTYNSTGQMLTADGPRSDVTDVTTYTYDTLGNLASVTNALGQTTHMTSYDANGRLLTLIDPNGTQTTLTYSPRGWLTSSTTAGQTTTYTYLANGKLQSVARPSGVTLHYEYDAAQRLTAIEDDAGNRIEYTLDLMGNYTQIDVKDPAGVLKNTVTQVYNNLGRLKQTIRGGNAIAEFSYDAEGRATVQEDPLGRIFSMEYDPLGRLIKQIDPAHQETSFDYDVQDNLTAVTDTNNRTTSYTYNGFGEAIQLASPDTGTTIYEYDAAGNRTAQVDARGIRTEYIYDSLNRLIQVHYPSDPSLDVTYTYDQGANGIGRLTRIDDATGYTIYTYDAWGNITSQTQVTDGKTYTVAYGYNLDNQLESITYPSGQVVTYSFDNVGNISEVSNTSDGTTSSLATGIGYLPFGPAEAWTLGNGLVVSRNFDLDYRLTGVTTTPVIDYQYVYDPVGNIVAWDNLLDASRSQTFGYDELDRLTDATGIYGDFDYSYDPVGNRLSKSETGSAVTDTYAYDPASNRLIGIAGASSESMTYDAVGNIVTRGTDVFTYNARNRLVQVSRNGSVVAQYQHNGKGERVIKTAGGNTTHFVYDLMGNVIAEADGAGDIQREYVYVNGERLALLQQSPTQATYYYHNDHLGTPKALTNASGTVVWQADYTPFGELTETVSIVEQPFRFPGQYFDSETGLYYNYFRDYDPGLGRYVQSDPIGLKGGLNTYAYVEGNPLSFVDPLGLARWQGRIESISYGGFGYGGTKGQIIVKSDCVDGKQWYVWAKFSGHGGSAGPVVSASASRIELNDPYESADPISLTGNFTMASSGFSTPLGGVTASMIQAGMASSDGFSFSIGLSMGWEDVHGSIDIEKAKELSCECE